MIHCLFYVRYIAKFFPRNFDLSARVILAKINRRLKGYYIIFQYEFSLNIPPTIIIKSFRSPLPEFSIQVQRDHCQSIELHGLGRIFFQEEL